MNGSGRRNRPLLPRLIMAVAAVVLFMVGYQWGNQYQNTKERPPVLSGVLIRPPQPLPDPAFRDRAGRPFGRPDLIDRWSLLVFVSPGDAGGHRSVVRLLEVFNRLADQPELRSRLRLLLVGAVVEPVLATDFERLSPAIAVLSAAPNERDRLRTALGTTSDAGLGQPDARLPPIFLIDPQARLVALFPASQTAAQIASDVASLSSWRDLSPGSPAPARYPISASDSR